MAEKRTIELEVNSNLGTLKQQLKEAKAAVLSLSEEFGHTSLEASNAANKAAELKLQIAEGNKLIKAFNPAQSLNSATSAMGGVKESIGLVGTSFKVLGSESEGAAIAMEKVGLAMEFTSGISSLRESVASFKTLGAVIKSTSVFQGIYNYVTTGSFKAVASSTAAKVADTTATVAQGTATAVTTTAITGATMATKLLRAALITSGIGAVVVLLAMAADAMGAFSGSTEDAEASQKKLDAALEETNKTIERQRGLFDDLKGIVDRQTKRDIINATNAGKSEKEILKIKIDGQKQSIQLLKEEEEESRKLYLKMSKYGSQKQYEQAEKAWKAASGKMKDAQLDFDFEEAERNKKKINTKKDNNEAEVNNDKDKNDKLKAQNDALTAYYDAIESDRQSKITDAKEKEQQELANKYEALYLLAEKAGISTLDLQKEHGAESSLIRKKYDDLEREAIAEKAEKEKERIASEKAFLDSITLTENQLKLQKLEEQYLAESILYKDNKEILAALDAKYLKDKEALNKDTNDKIAQNDKEAAEKKQNLLNSQLDAVKKGLSSIANIAELFAGKSKKSQKRAFDVQKATNIATATIDTFMSAQSAYKSLVGVPVVGPVIAPIAAAGAIAAGLMNIKKIKATQFEGGTPPTDSSVPTPPTGGEPQAPQFNVVGNNGMNQLAQLQQQPIQAYVVSSEMTSAQALERNRINNATI